ncbi:DUF3099 domain-containing protein [Ornithinimicrobium sp. Y1847]|uniref:DUF3099 domain-containing protein n=1 Tax=Ornithinimicrobium sp. Y1847 TaxID=3405419 RepID=UPI003B67B1FD
MPTTQPRHPARHPAQAVTTARVNQAEDRSHRMRTYLIAMGIRTASFPIAIWAFLHDHPIIGWIFVIMAVIIPSFAVMLANAVDHRGESTGPVSPVQQLGTGRSPEPAPSEQTTPDQTTPEQPNLDQTTPGDSDRSGADRHTGASGHASETITGTVVSRRDTAYGTGDADREQQ